MFFFCWGHLYRSSSRLLTISIERLTRGEFQWLSERGMSQQCPNKYLWNSTSHLFRDGPDVWTWARSISIDPQVLKLNLIYFSSYIFQCWVVYFVRIHQTVWYFLIGAFLWCRHKVNRAPESVFLCVSCRLDPLIPLLSDMLICGKKKSHKHASVWHNFWQFSSQIQFNLKWCLHTRMVYICLTAASTLDPSVNVLSPSILKFCLGGTSIKKYHMAWQRSSWHLK